MHIVYSSSDSYSEIAGISMLSLLENNKAAEEIHIYLIDNNISDLNKERLNNMVQGYGRSLKYLAPLDIEKLSNTSINVGRWNISTFYRLFLPTMLPETIERVLFIDCDTLVLQDLRPLWEMEMGDKWLYGVDDCRGAAYRTNIGLNPEDNYINNGVLLIDLRAWRENHVEELFLQFIHNNQGDITFVDQGVQNGVLSKEKRSGLLHPKYNCLTVFFDFQYESLIKLRRPPIPGKPEDYKNATSTPAIVHFQSCFRSGLRPWVAGCKHPYAKVYLQYKMRSPWKNEPLREDDRTLPQKLLNFGAGIMPEKLMVAVVSIIHTKLYPMARNIKQRIKKS